MADAMQEIHLRFVSCLHFTLEMFVCVSTQKEEMHYYFEQRLIVANC